MVWWPSTKWVMTNLTMAHVDIMGSDGNEWDIECSKYKTEIQYLGVVSEAKSDGKTMKNWWSKSLHFAGVPIIFRQNHMNKGKKS